MINLNGELSALLDKEFEILESGDFHKLATLITEKETLIDQISAQSITVDKHLHAKLELSQSLLSACINGVRSVKDRIDTIRKVHGSLSFYSDTGQFHEKQLGQAQKLSKRS